MPAPGKLRIIGGRWRGRKLPVLSRDGLRPTSDRVRETLFNWLQPIVNGAHCLDLYAGTGALGLEALSRGAAAVTLVEQQAAVCDQLRANARLLDAGAAVQIVAQPALTFLAAQQQRYDIVFVDPPFADDLWQDTLAALAAHDCLCAQARVYLELPATRQLPPLPDNWVILRDKRAGQVRFLLLESP